MGIQKMKAFTLIELLIAIFVLVVGILVVLQAFPLGMHVAKSGQMATVAIQLGQAKIEETSSKQYDEIFTETTAESYGEIFGFSSYKRVIEIVCLDPDLEEVLCDYDPDDNPEPIKRIRVTVYWRSPLGVSEKNVSITSLITGR